MHYPCSDDIYFSTTQHMSVYDVTYKTLGHTQPVISNASKMGEYSMPKKRMKPERNLSLNLSSINTER